MRTDIHSPSKIIPSDYTYVSFDMSIEPVAPSKWLENNRKIFKDHTADTGGTVSDHTHGGTCHCCGAWAKYLGVFYHSLSNTYIKVGLDCATKLKFLEINKFKLDRKNIKYQLKQEGILAARELNKLKKISFAETKLENENRKLAWDIYRNAPNFDNKNKQRLVDIIKSLVGNLINYGSLTEKQDSLLDKILEKYKNFDRDLELENKNTEDVPSGKNINVSGIIISTKVVENQYGDALKCLIKSDKGYKIFGSVPEILGNTKLKGGKISIKCEVIPSKDDSKFGFFKRPRLISFTEGDE